MNKNACASLLGRRPNDIQGTVIKVSAVSFLTIFVRIDVRTDLYTMQAQFCRATLQLFGCELGILQWDRSQPNEARGMIMHYRRNVVVKTLT